MISAVISTRNRPAQIAASVPALLASSYSPFELIVVDQSTDDLTRMALAAHCRDGRFRYLHSPRKGVSAGRNLGISHARGEILYITDDDCQPAPHALQQLQAAFAADPGIGVVFGNVLPAPHDAAAGSIPSYVRQEAFLARTIRDKHAVEGLSACMGIRRNVWEAVGGFDEMLGAGAPLRSGAESDFTIRALLRGYFVLETPELWVIHHGFRSAAETRDLVRRYWYGTGALFAKHLKCGQMAVFRDLPRLALRWIRGGHSQIGASLGGRTHHVLRLRVFLQGFLAGLRTPVEKRALVFETRI